MNCELVNVNCELVQWLGSEGWSELWRWPPTGPRREEIINLLSLTLCVRLWSQ